MDPTALMKMVKLLFDCIHIQLNSPKPRQRDHDLPATHAEWVIRRGRANAQRHPPGQRRKRRPAAPASRPKLNGPGLSYPECLHREEVVVEEEGLFKAKAVEEEEEEEGLLTSNE